MHGPIRRIYHKILLERAQLGPQPKEHMLAAATKALNNTAGVNGLVPTHLVFGALPHVILEVKQGDASFPTQLDRLHMMSIASDRFQLSTAKYRHARYRYATFKRHLLFPHIDMSRILLPGHPLHNT
jgi:hypothetical protein